MHVHCKIADSSWILEGIARNLSERIPYVQYDTKVNVAADVQYYISFHAYRGPVSPVEIGWFTHIEEGQKARDRFVQTAHALDHCVCHSSPYEQVLRREGVHNVITIPPGVDVDSFKPTIRVGVVGRVYGSGRKGEDLIAELMDVEGVEWHFTGSGWPGVSHYLTAGGMPGFYNSVDYVLVPSLIEAGPMSVVEALACGRPVIAPPIGWCTDFPHIEYRTGDAADLRGILVNLVDERHKLRASILTTTWDEFAERHDELFWQLVQRHDRLRKFYVGAPQPGADVSADSSERSRAASSASQRIHLVLPGQERSARGGPSVRVPHLARHLRQRGLDVLALHADSKERSNAGIVHAFNINPLAESGPLLAALRRSVHQVVFSPIHLDRRDHSFYTRVVPRLARQHYGVSPQHFQELLRQAYDVSSAPEQQPDPAWERSLADLINYADSIVCVSEHEKRQLAALCDTHPPAVVIENPVDVERWSEATPEPFREHIGKREFVLCVGRIEPRKNQLLLCAALSDTDLPLVFIGATHDPQYLELCKLWAGERAIFIDHLPNDGALLASAYAGATCCVLPSWAEGAPIAALEAGAAGARMVLSNRSAEREYFGDFAEYTSPLDLLGLRQKILAKFQGPDDPLRRRQQIEHVRARFDYDTIAERTADLYRELQSRAEVSKPTLQTVYVDLSQNAHTSGTPTGTCRVEAEIARYLGDAFQGEVRYVVWNQPIDAFVECRLEDLEDRNLNVFGKYGAMALRARPVFEHGQRYENAALLVLGGSWIGSPRFTNLLVRTVLNHRISLRLLVHDTMQAKFPWYPDQQKELFSSNLATLLCVSEQVFGNSRCTCDDVMEFARARGLVIAPPQPILFGQELPVDAPGNAELIRSNGGTPPTPSATTANGSTEPYEPKQKFGDYVLYVSSIDARKNHILLTRIWRDLIARRADGGVKLLFVGRKGWSHESVLQDAHGLLGSSLFILEGIDDRKLRVLYQQALFCVYPSLYEGWGLPVSEALGFAKITVASNRGSLPEVQPEATITLDPDDYLGWRDTVASLIASPSFRARMVKRVRESFRERSWRETAEELASQLASMKAGRLRLTAVPLDVPVSPHSTGLGMGCLEGDWSAFEEWGVWTDGESALVRFMDLDAVHRERLHLHVRYRLFVAPEHPRCTVTIRFNGDTVKTLRAGEHPRRGDVYLEVPRELLDKRAFPEVTFDIDGAVAPATLGTGTERRALGLGLEEIFLGDPSRHRALNLGLKSPAIRPGVRLGFCRDTERSLGTKIGLSGWTSPDSRGIWALRESASLFLHLDPSLSTKDLLVRLDFRGANRSFELPPIPVEVACEGQRLGEFLIQPKDRERGGRWLSIPASLHGGLNPLKLTIRNREMWRAAETEHTEDERTFGTGLLGVEVHSYDSIPKEERSARLTGPRLSDAGTLAFGAPRSHAMDCLGAGWSAHEGWGVWTVGTGATLWVPVDMASLGNVAFEVELEGRVYLNERHWAQRIKLGARSGPVEDWEFSYADGDRFCRQLMLAPGSLRNGVLMLQFETPDAISPHSLGLRADERALGIGLERLTVRARRIQNSQVRKAWASGTLNPGVLRKVFQVAGRVPERNQSLGPMHSNGSCDGAFVQAVTLTFLGRFLNKKDSLEERSVLGEKELVRRLVYSDECLSKVLTAARQGSPLPQLSHQKSPMHWVRQSLATVPGLSAETRAKVSLIESWDELIASILTDPGFVTMYLSPPATSKRAAKARRVREVFRA